MIDLTMMASAGLVNLALSGNGGVLQRELAAKNIVAKEPLIAVSQRFFCPRRGPNTPTS